MRGILPVPARISPGTYRLGLRLADPSVRLRDDSRYAVRLANKDIPYSTIGGWNVLVEDIRVKN